VAVTIPLIPDWTLFVVIAIITESIRSLETRREGYTNAPRDALARVTFTSRDLLVLQAIFTVEEYVLINSLMLTKYFVIFGTRRYYI
jgi:hypothetical protein